MKMGTSFWLPCMHGMWVVAGTIWPTRNNYRSELCLTVQPRFVNRRRINPHQVPWAMRKQLVSRRHLSQITCQHQRSEENEIAVLEIGTVGSVDHCLPAETSQMSGCHGPSVVVQHDDGLAQQPRPSGMNSLPKPLKCTTVTLDSYAVTSVKAIHKKQAFIVPKYCCHDLPYRTRCFHFLCLWVWWVFQSKGTLRH